MLHQERAHDEILVEKLSWVLPVGADAADHGREVYDDVRLRVTVERLDRILPRQVELTLSWRNHILAASLGEFLENMTAEESPATGHNNAFVGEIHRMRQSLDSNPGSRHRISGFAVLR